jgi:hypothetical protein
MDVLCILVSVLAGSTIFESLENETKDVVACGALWDYYCLGISLLFTQPHWNVAKKSVRCLKLDVNENFINHLYFMQVLDWILSMIDNGNVSVDQKRNLFNVLPSLTGIDKETFLKIIVRL